MILHKIKVIITKILLKRLTKVNGKLAMNVHAKN